MSKQIDRSSPRKPWTSRRTIGALIGIGAISAALIGAEFRARTQAEPLARKAAPAVASLGQGRLEPVARRERSVNPESVSEQELIERGYVPASMLAPAPTGLAPVPPPANEEPPDPASTRLPTHNPGGVDGDRPARPVPGIQ
jgi:hypothetical protein